MQQNQNYKPADLTILLTRDLIFILSRNILTLGYKRTINTITRINKKIQTKSGIDLLILKECLEKIGLHWLDYCGSAIYGTKCVLCGKRGDKNPAIPADDFIIPALSYLMKNGKKKHGGTVSC